MKFRSAVRSVDSWAVRNLLRGTGFFSAEEECLAVELVREALARGAAAGYEFLFADADDRSAALKGYSCFGRIPVTDSSYDLYWIAVEKQQQGKGLGRALLQATEARAREAGATRLYVDTSGRDLYEPTRAFYRNMGYDVQGVLRDFYAPGDDKVILAKRL
jgi:GNAT superfamily N-acetyltransferase